MMYKYETHLHTSPVSKCASSTVREHLENYKAKGFDGVFITNHFIDANIGFDTTKPYKYEDIIEFYFSDYEKGKELGKEIGIKVFCGIEISHRGTDFLVYGLDKAWFLAHPEIQSMKILDRLDLYRKNGAFIVQAHPFREASYIEYVRLFPRNVDGVEVMNSSNNDFVNKLSKQYAKNYGLLQFAGSDNHKVNTVRLAGMKCHEPVTDEKDFIEKAKAGMLKPFRNKEI